MEYILVSSQLGLLYQCVSNGIVIGYKDESGNLVDLTGPSEVVSVNPPTPSWHVDEAEPPQPVILPPVPESISRFQAQAALLSYGMLSAVENIMNSDKTPPIAKLAWNNAVEFKRNSPLINAMAQNLNLSSEDLDNLFRAAASIEV